MEAASDSGASAGTASPYAGRADLAATLCYRQVRPHTAAVVLVTGPAG